MRFKRAIACYHVHKNNVSQRPVACCCGTKDNYYSTFWGLLSHKAEEHMLRPSSHGWGLLGYEQGQKGFLQATFLSIRRHCSTTPLHSIPHRRAREREIEIELKAWRARTPTRYVLVPSPPPVPQDFNQDLEFRLKLEHTECEKNQVIQPYINFQTCYFQGSASPRN